jgi:hypothetical protein
MQVTLLGGTVVGKVVNKEEAVAELGPKKVRI